MSTFPLGECGMAAIIPEALSDLHSNDRSVQRVVNGSGAAPDIVEVRNSSPFAVRTKENLHSTLHSIRDVTDWIALPASGFTDRSIDRFSTVALIRSEIVLILRCHCLGTWMA